MALVLLGGTCATSSMALGQTKLLFSPLWATARVPAKGLTLLPPTGENTMSQTKQSSWYPRQPTNTRSLLFFSPASSV